MLKIMIMIMMMMTLMKLVNSRTKICPGIDKFYQPNSGLCSSRRWDEAIYIYTYNIYIHIYIYICVYIYIHTYNIYIYMINYLIYWGLSEDREYP